MTKTQDELKAAVERLGAWARLIEGAPKDGETFEVDEDVALDLAADLRLILAALRSPDPEVERLRGALADHDASVAECRIDGSRPQHNVSLPCDLCGARSSEPCGRKAGAAYQFIKTARAALSSNSGGR